MSQPSVLRESSLSLMAGLPLLPCGGGAWDLQPTPQDTLTPFKDRLTPPILWCSIFFLALKDSSKRSINSDWKIELPGEFQIAGTTVRYVRRGLWEKISAKGPTKMPLHLMVSGVLFVFVLSRLGLRGLPVDFFPGALWEEVCLVLGGLPGHLLLRSLPWSFPCVILFATCFKMLPSQNFALAFYWQNSHLFQKEPPPGWKCLVMWPPGRPGIIKQTVPLKVCFSIRWLRFAPQFV